MVDRRSKDLPVIICLRMQAHPLVDLLATMSYNVCSSRFLSLI